MEILRWVFISIGYLQMPDSNQIRMVGFLKWKFLNCFFFNAGNWQQALHCVSKAQVQDQPGRGRGDLQRLKSKRQRQAALLVVQRHKATSTQGDWGGREHLRDAVQNTRVDRVGLLSDWKGQSGAEESKGFRHGQISDKLIARNDRWDESFWMHEDGYWMLAILLIFLHFKDCQDCLSIKYIRNKTR